MSMFQLARSASLTAWPKRGRSGIGCTACGPVLPSGMPVDDLVVMPPFIAAQPINELPTRRKISLSLADGIFHLPAGGDGPRLDRIVVLHEAHDRARLREVLHARLHVAGAVD